MRRTIAARRSLAQSAQVSAGLFDQGLNNLEHEGLVAVDQVRIRVPALEVAVNSSISGASTEVADNGGRLNASLLSTPQSDKLSRSI